MNGTGEQLRQVVVSLDRKMSGDQDASKAIAQAISDSNRELGAAILKQSQSVSHGLDNVDSLGSAMLAAATAATAAAEAAAKPKRIEIERDRRGDMRAAVVVTDEVE